MDYILHILIIATIYVILSQSLTLTAGYSGLISLAHAGFYGIGAYTAGLLSTNFNTPFILVLLLAISISSMIAAFVSIIAMRTVDDYFIIITLGIQVLAFSLMNNWTELTNGPLGIINIPSISFFGYSIDNKLGFIILALSICIICYVLLNNLTKSPFGRNLIALSEDEIFSKSLGKNVNNLKAISFTIGAMIASVAGVLYAYYVSYIDPTSFTVDESIFILSIVIIGGMKNLKGAALASLLLIIIPELLRFIGLPSSVAGNVKQIIYGLALVCVMFKYKDWMHSKMYIGYEQKTKDNF
jgi:branched-chain amino acid transport system permease protein